MQSYSIVNANLLRILMKSIIEKINMPKKAKEKGVRQSILFKKSLQPSVNLSSNKPEKKPRKKKEINKKSVEAKRAKIRDQTRERVRKHCEKQKQQNR